MAFLVAGTLRVAAQMADARDSLARKGAYSLQGPRLALTLSTPEAPAAMVARLDSAFRALGCESCRSRVVSPQGFLGALAAFREQLDARGDPVGCALVALVAPGEQLQQPQPLVREMSRCGVLRGRPKVFLLLPSTPGAAPPAAGAFLAHLGQLCGRAPQATLQQLLTEVFRRVAGASPGAAPCPFFRSSLRGALRLQDGEPWWPEPEPGPSSRYDLSGPRAALLLAVVRGRPGAEHDVGALVSLCRALGFESTVRTNPTAQAFQEELARFRARLDARGGPVHCALVALMAHGGPQGQLLGADGQEVPSEELVQELGRCRALRGRPKIFLLQACRGGHRDAGMAPPALAWRWPWLRSPPATPSHADVLQVYAEAPGGTSRGLAPGGSDQADVLTVYAATEGYVAYRDESGSDFIQTLVDVVGAEPRADLLELLTEVNRRLCEQDVLGPGSAARRKACMEVRSSLRRALHLRA